MLQPLSLNVCDCVSVFVLKIYQSCDVLKKERNGRRQGRERVIVKKFFDCVTVFCGFRNTCSIPALTAA